MRGQSATETTRQALEVYDYFKEAEERGDKIQIVTRTQTRTVTPLEPQEHHKTPRVWGVFVYDDEQII